MNRAQLKDETAASIAKLDTLVKQLTAVVDLSRRSLEGGDGTNQSVMKSLTILKDNPDFPAALKPTLNKLHKAFYRNAEFNLEESVRERRQELDALKPAALQSKRGKAEDETEITQPLRLVETG